MNREDWKKRFCFSLSLINYVDENFKLMLLGENKVAILLENIKFYGEVEEMILFDNVRKEHKGKPFQILNQHNLINFLMGRFAEWPRFGIYLKFLQIDYLVIFRAHRDDNKASMILNLETSFYTFTVKDYYKNGLLHRDNDKPATEIQLIFKNKSKHAVNRYEKLPGPFSHLLLTDYFNSGNFVGNRQKFECYQYFKNGNFHREGDLPAFISHSDFSNEYYCKNGFIDRDGDLPVVVSDEYKYYSKNKQLYMIKNINDSVELFDIENDYDYVKFPQMNLFYPELSVNKVCRIFNWVGPTKDVVRYNPIRFGTGNWVASTCGGLMWLMD